MGFLDTIFCWFSSSYKKAYEEVEINIRKTEELIKELDEAAELDKDSQRGRLALLNKIKDVEDKVAELEKNVEDETQIQPDYDYRYLRKKVSPDGKTVKYYCGNRVIHKEVYETMKKKL